MKGMDVRVRAMLEESEIPASGGDELVELLVGLEERYVDAVPEPSPELAVLLGVDDASQATRLLLTPRRRRALAAGVVALGAVVTTGLAAAANELPEPAQRWVSELSDRYLPFDLPEPRDRAAQGDESTRRPDGDAAERSREEGGAGRRLDGVGTTSGLDGAAQRFEPTGSDHRQGAGPDDDGGVVEGHEDEPQDRPSDHSESESEDALGQGDYEIEDGEQETGEDTVPVKASPDEPDSSEESEESDHEESDHEEAEEAEGSGDE